jgi:hypothetical protein
MDSGDRMTKIGTTIHDEHVTVLTTTGRSRVLIDGARLSTHVSESEALERALELVPAHRRAGDHRTSTARVGSRHVRPECSCGWTGHLIPADTVEGFRLATRDSADHLFRTRHAA